MHRAVLAGHCAHTSCLGGFFPHSEQKDLAASCRRLSPSTLPPPRPTPRLPWGRGWAAEGEAACLPRPPPPERSPGFREAGLGRERRRPVRVGTAPLARAARAWWAPWLLGLLEQSPTDGVVSTTSILFLTVPELRRTRSATPSSRVLGEAGFLGQGRGLPAACSGRHTLSLPVPRRGSPAPLPACQRSLSQRSTLTSIPHFQGSRWPEIRICSGVSE